MKFSLEGGKTWKTLGFRTVLDLNNRQEIKKYIQSVIEFHDTLDNWYQTVDPEQIVWPVDIVVAICPSKPQTLCGATEL